MRHAARHECLERGRELSGALGRQIEAERFYGDESPLDWIVRPEHESGRASADLVQHAKRAERGGWRSWAGPLN
jgi:hypothetical protein